MISRTYARWRAQGLVRDRVLDTLPAVGEDGKRIHVLSAELGMTWQSLAGHLTYMQGLGQVRRVLVRARGPRGGNRSYHV